MTEINEMQNYDFIEGGDFEGLIGKAIDKAPATVGESKETVHMFNGGYRGAEAMKVVDITSFYEDSPEPGPEPGPVPPKPEPTQNDSAQTQTANNIATAATAGSGYTAAEGETINNFTIPEESPKSVTVTGPIQDGATITNNSPKTLTVNNTSEEPTSVTVITAPVSGSSSTGVNLKGEYNNIYVEGNKLTAATVNGQVVIEPVDENNTMIVNAGWQDGASMITDADNQITIANTNSANEPSIEVTAPNASLVMTGGQYTELTVTCADNTLTIGGTFHAKKLIMKKGNIILQGVDIHDFVDEIVTEGDITPMTYEISNASIAGLSKAGISNVIEDVISNSRVGFGIFASGSYRYNLNGHLLSLKGGTAAAMYFRGTPKIDIYGPGKIAESSGVYGIWTGAEGVKVNIYDADVEAYTHVLYAYLGEINVYGGTFKMLGENTDLDEKGHYKFLLNCYDANYTAGTARINVYGGKFYNFDPSDAYGEPGAPVSYVDKSKYWVEKTIEDGVEVFTVKPIE